MVTEDDGVLYHNPACSKSRAALELLREHGLRPSLRDYLGEPPDAEELARLLAALGAAGEELLRRSEPEFPACGLGPGELAPTALAAALARYPVLLQRPIYLRGGRAVIGRPPERVLELAPGG